MVLKAKCVCYGHWPKLQVWPEPRYLRFVCTETKALKLKHDCGDFKRDQQILWYFRHQDYSGLPLAWTINQAAYLLTSKIELKWYSVQVLWKDVTSTCPFLEEHVSRIFGHDFWCPASLKSEKLTERSTRFKGRAWNRSWDDGLLALSESECRMLAKTLTPSLGDDGTLRGSEETVSQLLMSSVLSKRERSDY